MKSNRLKGRCFVIMPFLPDLHYFYLYLAQHIEQNHNIKCERADSRVLTEPFLDKIIGFIRNADVIIADCTGRNPNVFYELGIAHALGKQVVLITQDVNQDIPSDIKHYEFIRYQLNNHIEFLDKLDNALHNVFAGRYEALYEQAVRVFDEFRQATGTQVITADKESFFAQARAAERTQELPSSDDRLALARFVLPRIVSNSTDLEIMKQLTEWLSSQVLRQTNDKLNTDLPQT